MHSGKALRGTILIVFATTTLSSCGGPAAQILVQTEASRAVSELRKNDRNIYVRFEDDGQKVLAHLQNEFGDHDFDKPLVADNAKTVLVTASTGVPVEEITHIRLASRRGEPSSQKPLEIEPIQSHRFPRLVSGPMMLAGRKALRVRFVTRNDRAEVFVVRQWSADGKSLYVSLGGGGSGRLVLVDAQTWEIAETARIQHLAGVTIARDGLIVTEVTNAHDSGERSSWTRIATNDNGTNRVWLLDQSTLQRKKCWKLRGGAVAGHPESPVIYLRQRATANRSTSERQYFHRILVFDTSRGELLNAFPVTNPKRDFPTLMRISSDQKHLYLGHRPYGSKQLFHPDNDRLLTGYRVDGLRGIAEPIDAYLRGTAEGLSTEDLQLIESIQDGNVVKDPIVAVNRRPRIGGLVVTASGSHSTTLYWIPDRAGQE